MILNDGYNHSETPSTYPFSGQEVPGTFPESSDQEDGTPGSSIDLEKAVEVSGPEQPPYTLFTTKQQYSIAILIGTATIFLPLTANIYLPCIPLLQHDYDVSLQLITITITAYVVVQSIAPIFFLQIAESIGRRLLYLLTFTVFVCASIGIALQRDYTAFFALRMLQGVGSSVGTSLGYAVVADTFPPEKRGKMLRPVLMLSNLGSVIAPVIGGPVCDAADWRWLFWFLTISASVFLINVAIFLPETSRVIVGNGIVSASSNDYPVLSHPNSETRTYEQPKKEDCSSRWVRIWARVPNPFKTLALLLEKDTACVVFVAGLSYATYYILQASLAPLFTHVYRYNETELGLCYLALAVGVTINNHVQFFVIDWNYDVTARSIGWDTGKVSGDDLSWFPIERARARLAWLFTALQCFCILGYGCGLHFHLHPSMPLVLIFAEGLLGGASAWNALLVDTHPDDMVTASAASSLVRGLMAAGGVAIAEPLYGWMGIWPFFALLAGGLFISSQVLIWAIQAKCMGWRLERTSQTPTISRLGRVASKTKRAGGGRMREKITLDSFNRKRQAPCRIRDDNARDGDEDVH